MSELVPEPESADHGVVAIATALAGRGFAVFPLRPDAKTPAVAKDWEHAASTDPVRLAALFRERRANLAIACGPSRLIVVDLDVAKAAHGSEHGPEQLSQSPSQPQHGADVLRVLAGGRKIPRTLTVATPTGGQHLYFRMPEGVTLRNTAGRLGPLIDTRGAGGYVVAPGSVINGLAYRIVVDAPVAELPTWIADKLAAPDHPAGPGAQAANQVSRQAAESGAAPVQRPDRLSVAYTAAALRNEVERVHTAAPGTRNDTLNRAAYSLGRLVGAGLLDREEVSTQLQQAAHSAGLPSREVAATTQSGLSAGIAHPRIPLAIADRSQQPTIHGKVFEQTFFGEGRAFEADPDGWSAVFGELGHLYQACRNLRRELTEFTHPVGGNTGGGTGGGGAGSKSTTDITSVLHAISDAQENVGFAASALTHSSEWHLIRAATDALRDLLDELENGAQDYSAVLRENLALNGLIRALVANACRRIAKLAGEITGQLSQQHLSRSPVWSALRNLGRVADNAAGFVDGLGGADGHNGVDGHSGIADRGAGRRRSGMGPASTADRGPAWSTAAR
jgi:Bifunctional DNA primase/polymerase, N-terminal